MKQRISSQQIQTYMYWPIRLFRHNSCGLSLSVFTALQEVGSREDWGIREEAEGATSQLEDHERKVDVQAQDDCGKE